MPEEVKTELQRQLEATKIRNIRGQPVKIPDLDQWEKVTKYIEKKNLTKVPRDDLENILFILWPYHHTISKVEAVQMDEITALEKELKFMKHKQQEENEEAMDVKEFFTRELQEKEEDITALRTEFEEYKLDLAKTHSDEIQKLHEQIDEQTAECQFLQREVEYAEAKLAGLGGGQQATDAEEAALKEAEKLEFQRDLREHKKELKDLEHALNEQSLKNASLKQERDAAVDEAENVKDTIKDELAQLEEDVSRELAAKDQELIDTTDKNEELKTHVARLESKINFLIKENAELEARHDVQTGGMTPRTPRTQRTPRSPRSGGGGLDILGQEQLELARAQVDGLERRNAEIKNQLEEAQIVRKEEVGELKGQIAQMIADQEELVEKAAQSDQLRDWLEQVSLEKEDDRNAADMEIAKLKAGFHTEKLLAIDAATEEMKQRNAEMEDRVAEADAARMHSEEDLAIAEMEIETLKNDIENLEIGLSQMKVQSRLNGGDTREVEALKKQIAILQQRKEEATKQAEKMIMEDRQKNAQKIHDLESKFEKQLEAEGLEQLGAVKGLQARVEALAQEKQNVLNINLAFAKQLREKEDYNNKIEFTLSDLQLQLHNATEDLTMVEQQKEELEEQLEELLEIQEKAETEYKENAEIIVLTAKVTELQDKLDGLEDHHLEELEQLAEEKAVEMEGVIRTMQGRYDNDIAERDMEIESMLNLNEEELDMTKRELNADRAMKSMQRWLRDYLYHGAAACIRIWGKHCAMASIIGVQRLLQQAEAKLEEFHAEDRARLDQMRETVQDEVLRLKQQAELEQKATRAAQSQLLFITNMTQTQLDQAKGETGATKLYHILDAWHQRSLVSLFYRWRQLNITGVSGLSEQQVGDITPNSLSADNIVAHLRHQEKKSTHLETLVLNGLHSQMKQTVLIREQASKFNRALEESAQKAKEEGERLEATQSVHELELLAKRESEKKWYLEKKTLEQEMDALKRKTDIEMGLFNQIQGALHVEKQGLTDRVARQDAELEALRNALVEARSEGAHGLLVAQEARVTVAFRAGIWKLMWIVNSWNQAVVGRSIRSWHTKILDTKCAAAATAKQEHSIIREQFEMSQYQYAVHTSALRESLQRLSMERAIEKLSTIVKRQIVREIVSVLGQWVANKVRDLQTEVHTLLEAQQRQMGLKNQELWVNLKDAEQRQHLMGMKTIYSVFSRIIRLEMRSLVQAWASSFETTKSEYHSRRIKIALALGKIDTSLQYGTLITAYSAISTWRLSLAEFNTSSQSNNLTTADLHKAQVASSIQSVDQINLEEALHEAEEQVEEAKRKASKEAKARRKAEEEAEEARHKASKEAKARREAEEEAEEARRKASKEVKARREAEEEAEEARSANKSSFSVVDAVAGAVTGAAAVAGLIGSDLVAEETQKEVKPKPSTSSQQVPTEFQPKSEQDRQIAYMEANSRYDPSQEIGNVGDSEGETQGGLSGLDTAAVVPMEAATVPSLVRPEAVEEEKAEEAKTNAKMEVQGPDGDTDNKPNVMDMVAGAVTGATAVAGIMSSDGCKTPNCEPVDSGLTSQDLKSIHCETTNNLISAQDTALGVPVPLAAGFSDDVKSRETEFESSSREVMSLLEQLHHSEKELWEQVIDGLELEAEYQRLERMLNPGDVDYATPSLETLYPGIVKKPSSINFEASHKLSNFEFDLIVGALKDAQDAIKERKLDNESLECEIERLEAQLRL